MYSAWCEDRNAKAVHFPEIFTLRLCRTRLASWGGSQESPHDPPGIPCSLP